MSDTIKKDLPDTIEDVEILFGETLSKNPTGMIPYEELDAALCFLHDDEDVN